MLNSFVAWLGTHRPRPVFGAKTEANTRADLCFMGRLLSRPRRSVDVDHGSEICVNVIGVRLGPVSGPAHEPDERHLLPDGAEVRVRPVC